MLFFFFFFNDTATTEIYTLSLHDALPIYLIEDYTGFESVKGWDLAQKMAAHAKKFGAEIVTDTVESVRRADGGFEVATARGRVYRAPAVILTAGGTPVKLDVPGEKEYAGKGG